MTSVVSTELLRFLGNWNTCISSKSKLLNQFRNKTGYSNSGDTTFSLYFMYDSVTIWDPARKFLSAIAQFEKFGRFRLSSWCYRRLFAVMSDNVWTFVLDEETSEYVSYCLPVKFILFWKAIDIRIFGTLSFYFPNDSSPCLCQCIIYIAPMSVLSGRRRQWYSINGFKLL